MNDGSRNMNPPGGLFALLREDYASNPKITNPGLWAVWAHRFGNARMGVPRPWRAPLTLGYRAAHWTLKNIFTVDLPYTVPWGRRSVIEHHTAVRINASEIGDDVRVRHCTTLGNKGLGREFDVPAVRNGVQLGAHVCIIGRVVVGHGATVAAGSVVIRSVLPQVVVAGNPAHPISS